ncbi:hypothetical protein EW026_g1293 [Hermanssonia centrifuga]|uniref:Heme peroxidase n=1 Tax=Hermanssonia centrifuga TaxID=98765 RepID=A0A4S4KSS9_9APHY|nr:hypothetical protein EW026_g1293 [Hermanssonia centrifuga]
MSSFIALADTVHMANRAPPKANDGRYDYQVKPKTAPDTSAKDTQSILHRAATRVQTRIEHGPMIKDPITFFNDALKAMQNKDAIDDRTDIFTKALALLCQLPPDSNMSKQLNDAAMALLYESLPHPPATFIGTNSPFDKSNVAKKPAPTENHDGENDLHRGVEEPSSSKGTTDVQSLFADGERVPRSQYAFRTADGSGNNVLCPDLGKAGMPYARSVQNKQPFPPNTLPDPGLVFDSLLKAREFQAHPGKNSSLTFAFASLVTHSLFRTDPMEQTINNTSSYLDLSILYGYNQAQQDLVRDKNSGRGLLYPDAFAEDRLVLVPPAASALLVILSRNHNYVATTLLQINERGKWSSPPPTDPKARAIQDEEIFQVAKLVNCGHFMAMIFGDYVAGFLGLGRDGNSWSMNPFDPIKIDGTPVSRGEGNHCSVEFNLLYRWHATTAQTDIAWTEDLFKKAFNNKPFDQLDLSDFRKGLLKEWVTVDPNPRTRTFANLKRGPDGTFSDDDLARVLQDATESVAGAYRARGTPAALRIVEILGMEQGRRWGVCSMNEFRKFLGLKPFSDFEEWNKDPEIAGAARQLYGHIDNLELYPGLQAEDCMPLGPGSGICCGYTMTRAILGDAIALVRGDRFFTTDYTPNNLTAWGFQDCARDPNNGAFGAAMPKLLFRHLPRHYPATSVYGLFPFFIPSETKKNLTKLKVADQYDFSRPKPKPIPKVVDTIAGIRHVFNDFNKFKVIYGPDMLNLTEQYGFFLVFDEQEKHQRDKALLLHSLFPTKDKMAAYVDFYKNKTAALIKEYSYVIDTGDKTKPPTMRVDIVRNVVNLISVHWVADYLVGIPLKTKAQPKGVFTEQEVYDMLSVLFSCVFLNLQPEHGWVLTHAAKQVADIINQMTEKNLNEASPSNASNPLAGFVSAVSNLIWPTEKKPWHDFLGKLAESGRPHRELVGEVIGLSVGSSMNYAQTVAQVVDFYLDDARSQEFAAIKALAARDDAASMELLCGYVYEARRLNPQFAGLFRAAAAADSIPLGSGKPNVNVQPGDLVFSSFRKAHLNPADFPDPYKVNPRRPRDNYQLQGAGFHDCPGGNYIDKTIPEIMKVIFRLKNLRRAPGPAGHMAGFMLNAFGTDNRMYIDNTGNVSPWPGSLTVLYDQ